MKIIAHRGIGNVYKENTIDAIFESLKQRFNDGVEFDVRITKDFKFVIHHDPFYKGHLISTTRAKVLQKLGLNTLEEILQKVHSNKIIMIEIKEERDKYHILTAMLYRILKRYSLNYYLQSFNYNLIKYFKKKHPEFKCGLLIGIKMNVNKLDNDLDFNSINYKHIKKAPLKETFVWTIDDKRQFDKLRDSFNIITDKSKYFYELIHGKDVSLPFQKL
ncbi:MAG: glycerophosphodiester phosphodiesterase [Bacilli bacterium]|nr:glycerophosphodiester phosphodiesterase [Bacilli bacterium]